MVANMQHFLEILKIIDGALSTDRSKVMSYANALADKLEAEGEGKSAEKIRRVLIQKGVNGLSTASFSSSQRLPVDSESRFALADEHNFAVDLVEVFLNQRAQNVVEEFLSYIKQAETLLSAGIEIAPSLLLYGPPGCGKSELAKYIASQLQLPLLTARADSLVSSYLGSTSKNLRLLFEHASGRPCVLFLDEFDAVAKVRDDQHELGELKRVVVSLLQNIDALDKNTILIAATNHEHLLDPAVWRRFAYKVHITLPDEDARRGLIQRFLGDFGDPKEVKKYVQLSEGLSGADLKQIIDDAKRFAVLNGQKVVRTPDLLLRIALTKLGDKNWSEDLEEQIRSIRNLDPKVFTVRVLSEISGRSNGSISKLIKELNYE